MLLVVSVGCSKNEDPIETVLSLSVDTVYCAWNVGEEAMEVDLSCSAPWIATTDQEWVVMSR